jgi:hypothetical protein
MTFASTYRRNIVRESPDDPVSSTVGKLPVGAPNCSAIGPSQFAALLSTRAQVVAGSARGSPFGVSLARSNRPQGYDDD